MKRVTILLTLSFFFFTSKAQKMNNTNNNTAIQAIEDRIALKNLVDTFSTLADQKETEKQTLLFTEDALSETFINGQVVSSLKGRKQIGETFAAFLNNFETVYHINGQQTVTLNGDKATGISYCFVTLIGTENGKKMKTNIGAYYTDDFVRKDGHWLIAHRKATFAWQEKQPLAQ
jgi:hypothetical protein